MNKCRLSAIALLIGGFLSSPSIIKAQGQPRVEQVRAGQTASGVLEKSDSPYPYTPAAHVDYWGYEGQKGEKIRITVRSEVFTPYVSIAIGKPGSENVYSNLQRNNKAAAGELILPEEDKYLIMVSSLDWMGAYTLLVEQVAPSASFVPPLSIMPGEMRMASFDDSDSKLSYGSYRIDDWEIQPQKGERIRLWVYRLSYDVDPPTPSVGLGRGVTYRQNLETVDMYSTGMSIVKEITFPDTSKYTIRLQAEFKGKPIPYKIFVESLGMPDDAAKVPNDSSFSQIAASENVTAFVRYVAKLHELTYRVELRLDYKKPESFGGGEQINNAVILAHVNCAVAPAKIQSLSIAGYRDSKLIGAGRPPAGWDGFSTNTIGGAVMEKVCKCQNWRPFTQQL
jgi:hypothetical protein